MKPWPSPVTWGVPLPLVAVSLAYLPGAVSLASAPRWMVLDPWNPRYRQDLEEMLVSVRVVTHLQREVNL